jgi:hypothetical protein
LLDLVAELDLEFFDHTTVATRNFHGGFVALHGDQTLVRFDGVAHLDHQLDHSDFVEVANVGDLNIYECHVLLKRLGAEPSCAWVRPQGLE